MATFVLIHGASADAHYWYLVRPLLANAGHTVVTPELPTDDPAADFDDYASAVTTAIAGANVEPQGLVIVGQSLGAFTAPIVAKAMNADRLVLVAPMIPAPGETPAAWGTNTGHETAMAEYASEIGIDPKFDLMTTFMHDVPTDVTQDLMKRGEPTQSDTIFTKPFPLHEWPDISTAVIAGTLDRMFPIEFQQRLCRERLGLTPYEIPTGHLPAFANPHALASMLLAIEATR